MLRAAGGGLGTRLLRLPTLAPSPLDAGGDLYGALRRHPELLRWDRLGRKVALDIAMGVHYLQSRRPPVLHRDLKSPNILLTAEGVAKIADVGMSRRMVSDLATAQPIMTPLWSAPEVLRKERVSSKARAAGWAPAGRQPIRPGFRGAARGTGGWGPSEGGNEEAAPVWLHTPPLSLAHRQPASTRPLPPPRRPTSGALACWCGRLSRGKTSPSSSHWLCPVCRSKPSGCVMV